MSHYIKAKGRELNARTIDILIYAGILVDRVCSMTREIIDDEGGDLQIK